MKIKSVILCTLLSVLFLTGCGSASKKVKLSDRPILDLKVITLNNYSSSLIKKDKIIEITTTKIKNVKIGGYRNIFAIIRKVNAYSIHSALIKLSENIDSKYFVILNPGMSNLDGFPINNMKDLERYMLQINREEGFSTTNRVYFYENTSLRSHKIKLFILPLENKIPNIPVWTSSKLKDYYKNKKL